MSISLFKAFQGISDYVNRHDSNYTIIEDNINAILVQLGGASGSLSVPLGLQEIFDRDGVIGIASYQLTNQTVVSDTLSIPAGAAWVALTFRAKSTSTALNTASLTTGLRYINIDSAGNPSLNDTQTAESVYSFDWDSGTDVVSNATLLVDILFDGDDYNDCLDSTVQAKNFTSLADRLEDIEGQLGVLGAMYAEDSAAHSGLNFGHESGTVRNDNVISTTTAGTVLLTDNATNFVEVTPSTGTVTTNTSTFTTLRVPLFEVTTSGGAITGVIDRRTWAALGGGGGGGGHAQNTDVGTDSAEFKLLNTVSGAPSSNGSFKVERGTSADVDVRWNETTDTWEFTNDGSIYSPLGAPSLGQQELSKFVTFENPPTVVDIGPVSSDAGWVKVDLTADSNFTSIVSGVQGMLLRVQFDDDVASGSTVVLFRQIENPAHSPLESMRVFARDNADIDADRGVTILTTGQGVDVSDNVVIGFEYKLTASGTNTARLKVFVMGYWDKVTGVGSQDVTFTSTGNVVAANSTVNFNLTQFADRALINKFEINETTGNPTLTYDIKTYKKDTFLAADLTYQVDGISPAVGPPNWSDSVPFFERDDDGTQELHISINNKDLSNSGTYDITVQMERFA